MRLTNRQKAALLRISREGEACLSPDLAKQLIKKGLVTKGLYDYQRVEWNRVVATLWVCRLTDAGKELVSTLRLPAPEPAR